jgi:hypothetical protein
METVERSKRRALSCMVMAFGSHHWCDTNSIDDERSYRTNARTKGSRASTATDLREFSIA